MDLPAFAKTTNIPLKTLRSLVRRGHIQDPLTEEDKIGLLFLNKIWGDREVLRSQMALFSEKRRLSFAKTAGLETKWERYAFSRFDNLKPGQNLRMSLLVYEIQETFGFEPNIFQIKRLYRVRMMVYNRRQKAKNSQVDISFPGKQ